MDGNKILEVIKRYRNYFKEQGIVAIDFPHDKKPETQEEKLGHCYGMLPKMEVFIQEGRMDKAFRWLGFIQGCLWSEDQYALEDLMDHSRPK